MLRSTLEHIKSLKQKEHNIRSTKVLLEEQKDLMLISDNMSLVEMLGDNKTILTKNFGLVQTIKLRGVDYSGISSAEYEKLFRDRKSLFDTLPRDVELCFYYLRKKIFTDFDRKKNLTFKNKHVAEINRKWQEKFKDAYKTEIYLAIRKKIPIELNKISKQYFTEEKKLNLDLHVASLSNVAISATKKLNSFKPEILKSGELIDFWKYLINCDYNHNAYESKNIGNSISLTDLTFNRKKRTIFLDDGKSKKYAKILSIKSMPTSTRGDILNNLMNQCHQFIVYQRLKPIEKEETKAKLSKLGTGAESLRGEEKFVEPRIQEIQEAGELVEANKISFVDYSFNILVLSDNENNLEDAVLDIEASTSQNKLSTLQEGVGLDIAFWSMFPDYYMKSGQIVKPTTHNLADLISLGSSHEGLDSCSFGDEPVAFFKTESYTNYGFTFHKSTGAQVNGNTLVIGATGTGKTTLLEFLLMNCLKYNGFRLLSFDSQKGMKVFTNCVNGNYTSFGDDFDMPLNPMLLPNSQMNKIFLVEWIENLCGGATEEEKELINIAVNRSFEMKKEDRDLTIVRGLSLRTDLAKRIEKWLPSIDDKSKSNYVFGMLYNGKTNSLNFDKEIICFDMDGLLENVEVLGSLSSFIFHSFKNYVYQNPCPHALFIDEMGRYIDNRHFQSQIKYAFQEIRKKNGIVIGAVQQPTPIIESEIGSSIISNTATLLLFPNPNANASEYLHTGENKVNLGLNDSEFAWILETPPDSKTVMLKRQGGESVILDVNLSSLGNYLGMFSSNNTDVQIMNNVLSRKVDDVATEYLKETKRVTIN